MFTTTVSSRDAAPEATKMYSRHVPENMPVYCTASDRPGSNIYQLCAIVMMSLGSCTIEYARRAQFAG